MSDKCKWNWNRVLYTSYPGFPIEKNEVIEMAKESLLKLGVDYEGL